LAIDVLWDGEGVSDLASAVDVLCALSDVCEGSFQGLSDRLPPSVRPTGPTSELFRIGRGHNDAGTAVTVTATRGDGRLVSWSVEAWIYPDGQDDWLINVKAEIDLDDSEGNDRCVLNEQEILSDSTAACHAIRQAAEIVLSYAHEDLLTDGWQPPDWDDAEAPEQESSAVEPKHRPSR
jgi:hypothetical protein